MHFNPISPVTFSAVAVTRGDSRTKLRIDEESAKLLRDISKSTPDPDDPNWVTRRISDPVRKLIIEVTNRISSNKPTRFIFPKKAKRPPVGTIVIALKPLPKIGSETDWDVWPENAPAPWDTIVIGPFNTLKRFQPAKYRPRKPDANVLPKVKIAVDALRASTIP